jgi:hypothetical protein
VSELLYIHSKVMIVDDRRVIVSFSLVLTVVFLVNRYIMHADGLSQSQ